MKNFIISDIHSSIEDERFERKLESLLNNQTKRAIFLGDISGASADAKMTEDFYQGGIKDRNPWAKHYGHWLSCQPEEIIEKSRKSYLNNLQTVAVIMKALISRGAEVFVIAGNRDSRFPWDFGNNKDELIVLPEEKRIVLTSKIVEGTGAKYIEHNSFADREKLLLFLSFDGLVSGVDDSIVKRINEAKKEVQIFAHGVPDWSLFNYPVNQEGRMVEKNFQDFLGKLEWPTTVFYGHAHGSSYDPDVSISEARYREHELVYLPLGYIYQI